MRYVYSAPASLMVWPEVRPRQKALRQHRLAGPNCPTMAFFLSWKASPPDLRKQPSFFHGELPPHLCPWAKEFRFPRTQRLIRPQGGYHLRVPRSRPPLQTPGTVWESAFSSAGRSQSLREGAPDTRLTLLSLSSPVYGRIVQYLVKRCLDGRCSEFEYLPQRPDDCSQGRHLRWCPAIALVP